MPRLRDPRRACASSSHGAPRSDRRVRYRTLLVGGTTLLALLLPGAVGAAWTTNLVQLDNGTCGQNLQIGSDKTASSSNKPRFWLMGDGGLSSYSAFVDGVSVGTFNSAGNGNVCITTSTPLADGAHTLTANELAPRPSMTVTPLPFSVDTVPPPSPSVPVLSTYSDSGVVGDGITRFRNVNLTGSSDPLASVQLFNGPTGIAGAKADSSGHWSATTTSLSDGVYSITAASLDSAGNKSALSKSTQLTIDSVAPATPITPRTLDDTTDSPNPVVAGFAAADVASIRIFSDGAQVGAIAPGRTHTWRFTLPSLTPGPHTVAVAAADRADNITPLSSELSLTITTLPATPPPPPPPESGWRPAPPDFIRPQGPRRPPPIPSG